MFTNMSGVAFRSCLPLERSSTPAIKPQATSEDVHHACWGNVNISNLRRPKNSKMYRYLNLAASKVPIIVVANRLPFVLQRNADGSLGRMASAGGLVTAVAPVVINGNGFWIGWPGIHLENPDQPIPESDPGDTTPTAGLKSEKIIAVRIDPVVFDSYYNGCSNAALWPLFHSMPEKASFQSKDWKNYIKANKEFAKCTLRALRQMSNTSNEVPLVWVHDYQLMLAAYWIKLYTQEERIICKLGFFLHIPFPPWDIFRLFPWHNDILVGLLACDMVGFHISDYCYNFIDCCQRNPNIGCRVDRKKLLVEHDDEILMVKRLPIGIPFDKFAEMAKEAPALISTKLKLILGVDRLDYTKGVFHRFLAFEKLLENHPEHLEKVLFLQISVPSRTEVTEYQTLKGEMDQLVGRINGRFATINWSPIRYIYGGVSQVELASFYRDATVALVTPLRDGMNLVAKEFVACQIKIPPGVLIVSPFAGTGETMHEALIFNPYELDEASELIHRALTMPEDERIIRMNYLRRREKMYDVHRWTRNFLSAMGYLQMPEDDDDDCLFIMPAVNWTDFDEYLANYLGNKRKLALLLDYDGTLAPIARHPDLAIMPTETKKVLERLSSSSHVYIAILSGRNVDNVKQMVGIEGITYAGNHGFEILHSDGTKFDQDIPIEFQNKLGSLMKNLQETVCRDGAWVENKGILLTFHTMETPKHLRPDLEAQAAQIVQDVGFKVEKGHCTIYAIPPVQWDKGRASIHILKKAFGFDWGDRIRIIFVGGKDDSNEDAMVALKGMAATFRVTYSYMETSAKIRLPSTDSVLSMLKWIETHLSHRNPSGDPNNSTMKNSLAKEDGSKCQCSIHKLIQRSFSNNYDNPDIN